MFFISGNHEGCFLEAWHIVGVVSVWVEQVTVRCIYYYRVGVMCSTSWTLCPVCLFVFSQHVSVCEVHSFQLCATCDLILLKLSEVLVQNTKFSVYCTDVTHEGNCLVSISPEGRKSKLWVIWDAGLILLWFHVCWPSNATLTGARNVDRLYISSPDNRSVCKTLKEQTRTIPSSMLVPVSALSYKTSLLTFLLKGSSLRPITEPDQFLQSVCSSRCATCAAIKIKWKEEAKKFTSFNNNNILFSGTSKDTQGDLTSS